VPENDEEPRPFLGLFARRAKSATGASRERIMGLDNVERGISLFAGGIAMVLAAVESLRLFKNTIITETAKPATTKPRCTDGYHLVASLCEKQHLTHPSYWLPQFLAILIIGLGIIIFALLRKRVGVITAALLLGLALGTEAGLPFLFCGGWLAIRAFRLQRYGDATWSGSNRAAREAGRARREGRSPRTPRDKKKAIAAPSAPPPPTESKRYTPKKPTKRRN
jgi:hypothetical protein